VHLIKRSFRRIKLIDISIRTKLLLIYLFCVLIPTLIFSYASYTYTMRATINEKTTLYRHALERVSGAIDSNAVDAIELANTIYADKRMYDHINRVYKDEIECWQNYTNYMKGAWDNILPYNTNIVLFTIYSDNSTLMNAQHLQRVENAEVSSDWFRQFIQNDRKMAFYSHMDELTMGAAKKRMISYIRVLNYANRFNHFIKITFIPEMLNKILEAESLPGTLYVVDGSNRIIAQTDMSADGSYNDPDLRLFDEADISPGEILLSSPVPSMDGWKVYFRMDNSLMMEAFRMNWMNMLILIFSITVFASVVIFLISSSLYRRIALLMEHMGKVSKGEYVLIPEESKGSDEIGSMITSMNSMTVKISELIEDVYKAKIMETQLELLKNRAELNALQCQVNPHFMFNVLETIRMKSFLKNEFETSRIIKYMSRIFRKLLTWDEDMIELKEELNYIREYLEIQQYRYEDELNIDIAVDERAMDLRIPKMTLQTLIDNACEHGFAEERDVKSIRVSVSITDDSLVEIKVFDNGKGMTREQIEQVQDIGSNEGKSIGIKNVIGRLNMYYGDKYSISINSTPGEYTEVILILNFEEAKRSN
jgi:two-component system sensor histidine kinase YesM